MHSSRSKQKYEKSALRISITGSTIFVILEIVYGGHHKVAGRPSGQCL